MRGIHLTGSLPEWYLKVILIYLFSNIYFPCEQDNANKSTVEVEDTLSKPDSEAAAPDEAVSYQTSIVGGVVHKVPINS